MRWDVSREMIARASVSKTMARPEYSQLAGAVSGLNNQASPKTATAGNPNLKPTTAENADASLAYYFSKNAYVQGSVFVQNMNDYVKPGFGFVQLINPDTQLPDEYLVRSSVGTQAQLRGMELSGETPIGAGFGVIGNLTLVQGKDQDGAEMIGTSRWTYNLRGYYESGNWTASLAWNQRDKYAIGNFGTGALSEPSTTAGRTGQWWAAPQSSMSASMTYKISPAMTVTVDALNLTDTTYSYYFITPELPSGVYKNGRQFYVNLRMKF